MTYQGNSDWNGKDYAQLPIAKTALDFDPATQAELTAHAGTADVHHAPYTDLKAQAAVDGTARSFSSVSITNAPADADDAIRKQEFDAHDHTGDALSPSAVTVSSAPDSANDVVRQTELDAQRTARIMGSPELFQTVHLGANEGTQKAVPMTDGETITIYRWGNYDVATGSSPSGVYTQFITGDGNVRNQSPVEDAQNPDGFISYTNTTGSTEFVRIRIKNTSTTDHSAKDIGGHVAFEVR